MSAVTVKLRGVAAAVDITTWSIPYVIPLQFFKPRFVAGIEGERRRNNTAPGAAIDIGQ